MTQKLMTKELFANALERVQKHSGEHFFCFADKKCVLLRDYKKFVYRPCSNASPLNITKMGTAILCFTCVRLILSEFEHSESECRGMIDYAGSLVTACELNAPKMLKILIDEGCDMHAHSGDDWTYGLNAAEAAMFAIAPRGSPECLQLLFDSGFSPEEVLARRYPGETHKMREGVTAWIELCVRNGSHECVRILADNIDVSLLDCRSAFYIIDDFRLYSVNQPLSRRYLHDVVHCIEHVLRGGLALQFAFVLYFLLLHSIS